MDRFLKEKTNGEASLTGKAFTKSNQALKAKVVELKQQGKGARPNKSLAITP